MQKFENNTVKKSQMLTNLLIYFVDCIKVTINSWCKCASIEC